MGFYKSQIQGFLTLFLRLQVYNFMRINIYFTLRKIYKCICNCTFSSRINQELTTNNNRTYLFIRNFIFRTTDLLETTASEIMGMGKAVWLLKLLLLGI